jgi:hypothetical protein
LATSINAADRGTSSSGSSYSFSLTLLDYHRVRREEEQSWDRARLRKEAGAIFASEIESRLPQHKEPFARDKLVRFTREPWFERCLELCELYRGATPSQRTWVRSRIDSTNGGKLCLFGLRAAVLAARERSVDLARAALLAYAVVDLADRDIRDTLIGFTLIVHCAGLAGADVPALLRETASISGRAMQTLYEGWAARYPDVGGIGSMGWRQVETEDGIGFQN